MKDLWIESANEAGKLIPTPRDTYNKNYSGRFNQRVSKDLHRRLVIEAELQDVSLNSLCERYLERGLEQDRLLNTLSRQTCTINTAADVIKSTVN